MKSILSIYVQENFNRLNDPVLQRSRLITLDRVVPPSKTEKWKPPKGRVYGQKKRAVLDKILELEEQLYDTKRELRQEQLNLANEYDTAPYDGRGRAIQKIGETIADLREDIARLEVNIERETSKLSI